MKYLIHAVTFILIIIVVNAVTGYLRKPRQAEEGKVYLPKFLMIFGSITATLFLIPVVIALFSNVPLGATIVFLILAVFSSSLIIAFINCRITYNDEKFIAKSFFGIKREYTYDKVTAIKENAHETFIYVEKKRVMIDEFSIGGKEFINLIKKKYRTAHDGKSIPKINKANTDIFNGNVKDAGGFIFAYILVGVLILGILAFSIYYTYFTKGTADNSEKHTATINSFDLTEDEIVLTSTDNLTYKILFINKGFNAEKIASVYNEQKEVTIYSEKVTPDDEPVYYSIRAIVYNDEYILSFDETNKLHIQEYTFLIIFAVIMCFIWLAFVILSIIIGRNPQKFSKRVILLFFKDGYVDK